MSEKTNQLRGGLIATSESLESSIEDDRRSISESNTSSSSIEHGKRFSASASETSTSASDDTRKYGYPNMLWVSVGFASLGGLVFGWDIGSSGGTYVMKGFQDIMGWTDNESRVSLDEAWISTTFNLGALLGCLPAGYISDKMGRKVSLRIANIVFIIGAILRMCTYKNGFWLLLVGRVVGGMGVGALSTVVPSYISEIAPSRIKGTLSSLFQFMITFGLLLAACCNLGLSKWSDGWRLSYGGNSIFCLIMLIGLQIIPESPRWLIMINKEEQAESVLALLRSEHEIEEEKRLITKELNESMEAGTAKWSEMCAPHHKMWYRTTIIWALAILVTLSGMNAIMFFAPSIIEDLFGKGTTKGQNAGLYGNLLIMVVNWLCTVLCVLFVDKFGRKPLLFWGGALQLIACLSIAILASFDYEVNKGIGYGIVAACCLFVFAFSWSGGPIMWIYCTEILPTSHRSKGAAFTAIASWGCSAIIGLITPILADNPNIGLKGLFGIFTGVCILLTLFVNVALVETAGKSLTETDVLFDQYKICTFDLEGIKLKRKK